ncbi:MAG: hypothetical protein ACK5ZG_04465 [Phycisphaerae bacterium]
MPAPLLPPGLETAQLADICIMRMSDSSQAMCPECHAELDAADVNVGEGVALCRECEKLIRLSHLLKAEEKRKLAREFEGEAPSGTWTRDDGRGMVVGASMRSFPTAFGLLFFCLFWNGIISVFVAVVLASTLKHMGLALPAWFPAPNMNGSPMSVGMTVFLWLFLTPFMLIGLGLMAAFLSALGGRVEVSIDRDSGKVFEGIGLLGWTRRFDVHRVKDVRLEDKQWTDRDGDRRNKAKITIEADKTINFGSGLSVERRRFIAAKLSDVLQRAA